MSQIISVRTDHQHAPSVVAGKSILSNIHTNLVRGGCPPPNDALRKKEEDLTRGAPMR